MSYNKLSIIVKTIDPTINDDSSTGYQNGQLWINTTYNSAFVCYDNSVGASSWEDVSNNNPELLKFILNNSLVEAMAENGQTWTDNNEELLDFANKSLHEHIVDLYNKSNLIDVTYDELNTLIAGNELKKGFLYKITDFTTKHLIPYTVEINEGSIEELICLAISNNKISHNVYSELYPDDIIHYDITYTSCEDGTWDSDSGKFINGTERTGKITYRNSTINNLECHYDWRNVKFRRWRIDADIWVSGTSYSQNDIITYTTRVYKAMRPITTNQTVNPAANSNWIEIYDFQTSIEFPSWTPIESDFNIGGINTGNLIINNTTPGSHYADFYTFTILEELDNSSGITNGSGANITGYGYNNISIGDITNGYLTFDIQDTFYNNIVFFLETDGNDQGVYCFNNKFRNDCTNSTIVGINFQNNAIKNLFGFNFIQDDFQSNIINDNFFKNIIYELKKTNIGANCQSNIITEAFNNIIGADMSNNSIKKLFRYNNIASSFYQNAIGSDFTGNTIVRGFTFNTIVSSFNQNLTKGTFNANAINDNFTQNTIGHKFDNNQIGTYFVGNHIKTHFRNNIVENNFQQNTIGNYFEYNTLINSNFQNNQIGNNFSGNRIYPDFQNNDIGNNFYDNFARAEFQNNQISNDYFENDAGEQFQNNIIENEFNNNTINTLFQYNKIMGLFSNNANIGSSFSYNVIFNSFSSNISIGYMFQFNVIGSSFNLNTIGENCVDNTIKDGFNNSTTVNYFRCNVITSSINLINFSTANHVYNTYHIEIFSRADGTLRLKYYDNDDNVVIDDITS